jgi:hypothetical protein
MINLLELFAGTRSVGKEAGKLGIEVFSSDLENFKDIDYQVSILDFDISKLPFKPDIIWASPPCTLFSNANQKALSDHWDKIVTNRTGIKYVPKSEQSRQAINILRATLSIIKQLEPKVFYIENPALGRMKHLDEMKGFRHVKVSYFDYGFDYWKPTNIFTNDLAFIPRPFTYVTDIPVNKRKMVLKTGGAKYRSKIPPQLCEHILTSAIDNIDNNLETLNSDHIFNNNNKNTNTNTNTNKRLSRVGIQQQITF